MVSIEEHNEFIERVKRLRLNADALEEVRVHLPGKRIVVPNAIGSRNSLMIFADAISNDGYISRESAERALEVYGPQLRDDAFKERGRHPNIDLLEEIVRLGNSVRADVIRRNSAKPIPERVRQAIEKIKNTHGTPFYVYDAQGIHGAVEGFNSAFSWVPGRFKNYFAVKALPNPSILSLLHKGARWGMDCSSMPELSLAEAIGARGEDIMFTSNDTPPEEFVRANNLGAIINLDDITHIDRLQEAIGKLPRLLCFRYNPGKEREGTAIIGSPEEAKYGLREDQLINAYRHAKGLGVRRFGFHTMIVSNMLNEDYLIETGRMAFNLGRRISSHLGIQFDFFNIGGGVGTAYKPEQIEVDKKRAADGLKEAYVNAGFVLDTPNPEISPRVFMECGRAITGPHGYLVSRVRHVPEKHKNFIGLDASMADLMRPGMYGAYHHMIVLGKEDAEQNMVYDVTGSLCENNDKFAVNRPLPLVERGDTVVIFNGGAHSHSMGFQYNGKLRPAEFLVFGDGSHRMIRRKETEKDYFATLDFPGSEFGHLAR